MGLFSDCLRLLARTTGFWLCIPFLIFISPHNLLGGDWVYETGDLRGVWGSASNDVYAVGKRGIILRYNGTNWKPVETGFGACSSYDKLKDIWGSSATDIYAVGCYDSSWDERFDRCLGGNGVILHYDGSSWGKTDIGGTEGLNGVWGSSASEVFAVGSGGTILHYDGNTWAPMDSGTTETLAAVWGTGPDNVYAVGASGTILHYDGVDWQPEASGTTAALNGVWGSSASNVFVVGEGGTILRDQGAGWTPPASGSGTTEVLTDVWGGSANNVFALGDGGTILRFNGTSWSAMSSNTTTDIKALWGSSVNNIFAVGNGNTILRYTGSWSIQSEGTTEGLNDVWGTSENNVFVVGSNGTIMRYTGSGWKKMVSGTTESLTAVWGSSVNNIYAVGRNGTILQYNGSGWTTIHSDPQALFSDIWGSSGSDIYVVGRLNTGGTPPSKGLLLHYDGNNWTSYDFSEFSSFIAFHAVWGTGPDDIFVVGSVWGGGNYVYHFNGSGWSLSLVNEGVDGSSNDVWGSSGSNVIAVGASCPEGICTFRIIEFDGNAWNRGSWDMPFGTHGRLGAVWGRSANEVFAVGGIGVDDGQIILRSGGGVWWHDRYTALEPALWGVWGSASGHVFAVGGGGTILRLFPESEAAVPPGSTWARTYGGGGLEEAKAVEPTADDGSIVVGQTESFGAGGTDMWVVKLDAEGTLQWQKTLGGVSDDRGSAVKETTDGGYVVAGSTSSFGAGSSDAWIVKLDASGNVVWQNAYGGSGEDSALEILTLGNAVCGSGYVVLGRTQTGPEEWDAWVMKLNSQGEVSWRKTYPMPGMESLVSLDKGKGYGYFISGKTHHAPPGYSDFLLLRLDDDGEVQWAKTFGLELWTIGIEGEARLCVANDGGVALVGRSSQVGIPFFAWMLKLNALGQVEWQRVYRPSGDADVTSIQATRDLGYIIGGKVSLGMLGTDRYDGWLLKLSSEGDVEWQKVYGGLDARDQEFILSVRQGQDGGYLAAGKSSSLFQTEADSWVLRVDESGLISDCGGVSTWYGGADPFMNPDAGGADISITAVETETIATPTDAPPVDTEVTEQDACLSTAGDLIDLPQTGQTGCYNASGDGIPCGGTGQDGDVRAGVAWPSPRFVDNGDGTMLDMITGLVWLKDANYAQTVGYDPDDPDPEGLMDWAPALDFIAAMNAGQTFSNLGYNDWRAPSSNEIESLIHYGVTNVVAWLTTQGFEHVQSIYWSSTTHYYSTSTNYAWAAVLEDPRLDNRRKDLDSAVWPVRGGQMFHPDPDYPANVWKTGLKRSYYPGDDGEIQAGVAWPSPRFTDHGDGTVTDNLTGLMWLKDTNCFGDKGWMNALATVADFNTENRTSYGCPEYTAEYTDWHLPNLKEFLSLVDRSKRFVAGNTALSTGHPFQVLPDGSNASFQHWSSDTVLTGHLGTQYAWQFTLYGMTQRIPKNYGNRVWPVRGGVKCYGDCDRDGDVDGSDLAGFLVDFLADNPSGECSADFNDDGHVDGQDLARFSASLGRTHCPGQ